jgi:uncharacterized surface protein with fasciclin (FAS1) repeats
MNLKLVSATAVISLTLGAGAMAAMDPMVGGASMYDTKNIIQNAVNSKDHTTLVAAVKAAGLVQTLEVFAPTNEAFAALPAGTVDTLLKPENKAQLTQILTYHVVPGRYDVMWLDHAIKTTPGGRVSLKTAEGELLIAAESGNTHNHRSKGEYRPGHGH